MPRTSFSCILCHHIFLMIGVNEYIFAQKTSCAVHYDVIYHPFPFNSQYLKTWGVDSSAVGHLFRSPLSRRNFSI